jgi:hypothetical protein
MRNYEEKSLIYNDMILGCSLPLMNIEMVKKSKTFKGQLG